MTKSNDRPIKYQTMFKNKPMEIMMKFFGWQYSKGH